MADRRARSVIVASGERALHIIQAAGRQAKTCHIDREVYAFRSHGSRQVRRIDGDDAVGEMLGDRDGRQGLFHVRFLPFQVFRRRTPPKPGMRLMRMTTAKVNTSMTMPSTAMAPRSPLSLRSNISTEITLVSDVNSMTAADSSRMTPMNMKHH